MNFLFHPFKTFSTDYLLTVCVCVKTLTYGDVEVFLVTRLDGPPEGHGGLTICLRQGQEGVALFLIHQGK